MRKMILRFIPPAVLSMLKFMRNRLVGAEWEYMPLGFAYKGKNIKGWNVNSIVKLQLSKWSNFHQRVKSPGNFAVNHEAIDYDVPDLISHNLIMSFSYVCLLAAGRKNNLSLLDWGGGIGHYGLIAKEALPGISIDYWCYDLEVFGIGALEALPDAQFVSDITFVEDLKFDLVNISSSIWYDPEWKQTLLSLRPSVGKYIYITRMIFVENESTYVAIQKPYSMGYKTEYLCLIFNKRELIDYVISLGYTFEREFYFGPAAHIYKAPEQGNYLGFLFKKNEEQITTG
jgi:putative methyltransferase (TIGR04325 family)